MYLFVISIILAVAFLLTVAFIIAYFFIYRNESKKDIKKIADLTSPIEYFYVLGIPLILIQLCSFVLNRIGQIQGDYVLPKVGLIFGSIYNTIVLLTVAYIVLEKIVFKKREKLALIVSLSLSITSIIVVLAFTIAMFN